MSGPLGKPRHIIGKEVQLLYPVGSGSYGDVFLAKPIAHKEGAYYFSYPSRFVVKVIRKNLCTPGTVEAINRELETLKGLQHPFIVSYIGSWIENAAGPYGGSFCLAMEYCNGGDLANLQRTYVSQQKPMPDDLVFRVMVQVLSAISYSHSQKIIHRDIKPANVFLRKGDGDVVTAALLGDFGLARPLDQTAEAVLTRVGTPCYLSPEIAQGRPYTTKTDIFSAGVMFFELMTLDRPFWRPKYTERMIYKEIVQSDVEARLRRLSAGRYHKHVINAVAACLNKKEALRPSALELLTDIASPFSTYIVDNHIPIGDDTVARHPHAIARAVSPAHPRRPQSQSPSPKDIFLRASPSPRKHVGGPAEPKRKSATPTPPPLSPPEAAVAAPAERHEKARHVRVVSADRAATPESRNSSTDNCQKLEELLRTEFPSTMDNELSLIVPDRNLRVLLRAFVISHAGTVTSREEAENIALKLVCILKPSLNTHAMHVVDLIVDNIYTTQNVR